ncbi:MAG: diaminopimelate epimerase [Fervidobacterium sp.]
MLNFSYNPAEKYKKEKYNATGNTFVLIDLVEIQKNVEKVMENEKREIVLKTVEKRDGVIFVEKRGESYHMDYFNRDGNRASFCGNGARTFAYYINKTYYNASSSNEFIFSTNVGYLKAKITDSRVSVEMPKPKFVSIVKYDTFEGALIEVGVPHVVFLVNNVDSINLESIAPKIRWEYDANVNFFEIISENNLKVRTYERGVERETLSCGSGITSTAYFYNFLYNSSRKKYEFAKFDELLVTKIKSRGGDLSVIFNEGEIFLEGGIKNE